MPSQKSSFNTITPTQTLEIMHFKFSEPRLLQHPISNVRESPDEPWPPAWSGLPYKKRTNWKRVKLAPDNLLELPPKKPNYLVKLPSPKKPASRRTRKKAAPKKAAPKKAAPKKATPKKAASENASPEEAAPRRTSPRKIKKEEEEDGKVQACSGIPDLEALEALTDEVLKNSSSSSTVGRPLGQS